MQLSGGILFRTSNFLVSGRPALHIRLGRVVGEAVGESWPAAGHRPSDDALSLSTSSSPFSAREQDAVLAVDSSDLLEEAAPYISSRDRWPRSSCILPFLPLPPR